MSLITEAQGVSQDVQVMASDIYKDVLDIAFNYPWSDYDGMKTKSYSFKTRFPDTTDSVKTIVTLFAFDDTNENYKNAYQRLVDNGFIDNNFNLTKKTINLYFPWPLHSNSISDSVRRSILSTIAHESLHAFQDYKKHGRTGNRAAYASASNNTYNTDDKEEPAINLLKYYIKDCYYFFDEGEIDAFIQGLFNEVSVEDNIEEAKTFKRLQKAFEGFDFIKKVLYPKDNFYKDFYRNARNDFPSIVKLQLGEDITAKEFLSYCNRGVKNLERKLRRLIGYIYEIQARESRNRGSFKNYAKNEIPEEEFPLRKKVSFLRKLYNYIKTAIGQ
jgi:hypothetical protein